MLEKAERRQLTVMFCDLVGSTELSHRLDPEELREVMRRYQDAVAGVVAQYEGYVAKFLGDGVLTYFGWPRDYENQAERAVRAGLDATMAVKSIQIDGGEALDTRVGIATGEVVIGDMVGQSASELDAVVGETPNLAARLQGTAAAGQLVIGAMTRHLVGDLFALEDLGAQDLKGFSEPVRIWRVIGEGRAESRFEATRAGMLAQFIGREHELGLLRERWELATGGEGQIVLLSGEAGIGKSRILQALRDEIGDQPLFRLRYQCSPHHTNSAFYPVVQRLERAAGLATADTVEAKLDKLEALLRPTAEDLTAIAPLFAALLSLPAEARYGPLDLTPQQRRDRTIDALIDQLLALSRQRPVLFVFEDAHWIDPSTENLIGEIMARAADAAMLMLITHRPEYKPPWADHPHLTSIALNRLSRRQGAEIVQAAGGKELPGDVVDRIIARADGVPLYIEELTKSVLEAGRSADGSIVQDEIPTTLQALLIARLDRLGEAKPIAQVGSVFGRKFSYGLLTAVAGSPEAQVHANLERLVQSELIFRRGVIPDAIYTFKHALIQDAAYGTLLRRRRQQLHARIGEMLERKFPEIIGTEPETLAHHYSKRRMPTKRSSISRSSLKRRPGCTPMRRPSALWRKPSPMLRNSRGGRGTAVFWISCCAKRNPSIFWDVARASSIFSFGIRTAWSGSASHRSQASPTSGSALRTLGSDTERRPHGTCAEASKKPRVPETRRSWEGPIVPSPRSAFIPVCPWIKRWRMAARRSPCSSAPRTASGSARPCLL